MYTPTARALKPPFFRTSARIKAPEANTGPFWSVPLGSPVSLPPSPDLTRKGYWQGPSSPDRGPRPPCWSRYTPQAQTSTAQKLKKFLRPLIHQYPNHVLGGDDNCIMCPELDGANLQTDNEWPWLWRQVTSDPPHLIDTFGHFHPAGRSFSRYPTPYRARSSHLSTIF